MTQEVGKGRPFVSVVIEGYNESRELGTAAETVRALARQDYPLELVEVVLVGSPAQARAWDGLYSKGTPFFSVKTVEFDGDNYYESKCRGARVARGEIIAFTDSDVRPKPSWLSSAVEAIEGGADVAVGLSLFGSAGGLGPDAALMQVAASVTWGWIVGKSEGGRAPGPVGFMDHNVAFRARTFRSHEYNTDRGRVCTSTLLCKALAEAGARLALQPGQQAEHYFAWTYWLRSLHFRYGYEVYTLRRVDEAYPNQWIKRAWLLEPLVTMGWHILLDVPRWFRFSRLLGLGRARRLALLPLLAAASVAARAAEMAGMCATLLAPDAMREWAEKV